MHYYNVAPTIIIRDSSSSFTYGSDEPIAIGAVVKIPVGSRNLYGIVVKKTNKPSFDVKQIEAIVYAQPIPQQVIATAQWISRYYRCHTSAAYGLLLPRGVAKQRRARPASQHTVHRKKKDITLTQPQQQAIETIWRTTGTSLLHGVTGSGKTQVYIEIVKRTLKEGKSAIILVPEIALTTQLIDEFSHHFNNVITTHSQQTEAERHAIWEKALTANQPVVAIGPRSALFLPLHTLGCIVIDECHEPSYKQENIPRYSALRVAKVLADNHAAKLIIGSATPSITDYYTAESTQQAIARLPTRAAQATTPDMYVVDATKRHHFNKNALFSDKLLTAIEAALDDGKQTLLFHNRRGTATTILCESCGWQALCQTCYTPLTLHADTHHFACHSCATAVRAKHACPECQSADILFKGIGTKRIYDECQRLFPNKKIVRFDTDTPEKESIHHRYGELYNNEIDIIIGTQTIAKGLDLPHLQTVGVIQADTGLAIPDFSSSERTFQLLSQVIGRVGRSKEKASIVIQTYQPKHPAIEMGITQDYEKFYRHTLRERESGLLPPFTYLLHIVCSYKNQATAVNNAKKLAEVLRSQAAASTKVSSPSPAFYERYKDTYRWQIIVKSPKRSDLIDLIQHIPKTKWQYELDPTNLL